jgi:hypothetical protein
MGYYAAGGYYEAGGFSFKKLGRWAKKQAGGALGKMALNAVVGLVPGGSTILTGLNSIKAAVSPAKAQAVAASNSGTPGAQAFTAMGGPGPGLRRGRRTRRRRGSWRGMRAYAR